MFPRFRDCKHITFLPYILTTLLCVLWHSLNSSHFTINNGKFVLPVSYASFSSALWGTCSSCLILLYLFFYFNNQQSFPTSLEIANLFAYIAKKNAEISDDDEWDNKNQCGVEGFTFFSWHTYVLCTHKCSYFMKHCSSVLQLLITCKMLCHHCKWIK